MNKLSSFFNNIKIFIFGHKIASFIVILALSLGGYFTYNAFLKGGIAPSYVTAAVSKGTVTTSVSGSGQVSSSNTVSLQFKASGNLIYLPVKNGQAVSAGQLIAQLDTTDARKSIRNAESSLQSAQISYQKIIGTDMQNPQNKQDAESTLVKDYESGYNTVANAYLDLPNIITGLHDVLYGNTFNNYQDNASYYAGIASTYSDNALDFKNRAEDSYQKARSAYDNNFSDYKASSRFSDNATIDSLINETYETSKSMAQAIKDANNLIQFYKDTLNSKNIPTSASADTHLTQLSGYLGSINSALSNLLNAQNTIKGDKNSITNAGLDAQSQQLSLQNSQNSLSDAKDTLANYYIYAPFYGILGKISAQKGDNVSSGTVIATLLTNQKICTIPLNEVDVSKVQVGQKAVLTFDALLDLTVAGQVATIDPVGTVSQGVVTYNVQINFDTQDARVKSGMSISAQIITNVKQDVVIAPNSAIKTQGSTKYVQILTNGILRQQAVTTGLSNDSSTEIVSGVNEGDQVVTQTITSSAGTASLQNNSGLRIPGITGGSGGGGNFIRTR